MAYAARPGVSSVILAGFWEDYFIREMLVASGQEGARLQLGHARADSVFDQFSRDLLELTTAGKRVYVVLSNPTLADAYRDRKNLRRLAGFTGRLPSNAIPRSDVITRSSITNSALRVAAANAGATVIDPVSFLCDSVVCPTYTPEGMPIYRDYHHMRAGFVRKHVRFLDEPARH